MLRSYLLAGNSGHYDGVICRHARRRACGWCRRSPAGWTRVRPSSASSCRTAVPPCDAVVSLTGFSLVGGPAYNDAQAAEEVLARLDVPYLAAHPVEFQTLDQWGGSERGLLPVESTIMVAIPELDGATGPTVFGGRVGRDRRSTCVGCDARAAPSERQRQRARHAGLPRARRDAGRARAQAGGAAAHASAPRVASALVIFNFPPNAGNVGTAAFLGVFESLHNTLLALRGAGLQRRGARHRGGPARGGARAATPSATGPTPTCTPLVRVDDHVRRERWLKEIEAQWGAAPGRQLSDGSSILVLGRQFGNVFVGRAARPSATRATRCACCSRRALRPRTPSPPSTADLREDFAAHAVLHFGTHGALEFMPGKQSGMSGSCWPDRLIGDLPNLYLYASNNPSEGAIAKRRVGATLHQLPHAAGCSGRAVPRAGAT
jgi:magnesium chelatase subunit H